MNSEQARYEREADFAVARAHTARGAGDEAKAAWWEAQADLARLAAARELVAPGGGRKVVKAMRVAPAPPRSSPMELVPRCGVQGRGENLSEPEPDEAGAADPAEAGEPALPERHAEELDAVTPDALARLFEHPEARVYAGFPGRVAVTRVWAWCLDPSGRLLLSLDRGWAAAPAGLRVFYACDDPAWTQFSVVE